MVPCLKNRHGIFYVRCHFPGFEYNDSKGDERMKMRSTAPMRVAKVGYIVMSAVFCAVGLIFIIRPDVSAGFLGYLLGTAMIVFGAIKIVGYFSKALF